MASLFSQIRRVERLRTKLINRVRVLARCIYNPHGLRCYYPRKRGFIYCPLHVEEYLKLDGRKIEDLSNAAHAEYLKAHNKAT